MDSEKLQVVVSEAYSEDVKNIFNYGVETFGYTAAVQFYKAIDRLVNNLEYEYCMYPECRFLTTKSKIYRNIILESYLIIYRITKLEIEVLRVLHTSVCTASQLKIVRKIKI